MRGPRRRDRNAAIKTKGALWTVLLHLRMNECRLRIILIRLWFRTVLEEREAAEIGGVGGGARRGQTRGSGNRRLDRQCLDAAKAITSRGAGEGPEGRRRDPDSPTRINPVVTMSEFIVTPRESARACTHFGWHRSFASVLPLSAPKGGEGDISATRGGRFSLGSLDSRLRAGLSGEIPLGCRCECARRLMQLRVVIRGLDSRIRDCGCRRAGRKDVDGPNKSEQVRP
jgi:hypothetical protein